MREVLGIETEPLIEVPLPPHGFAPWEPWPPKAAERLFMERLVALDHAHRSSTGQGRPFP